MRLLIAPGIGNARVALLFSNVVIGFSSTTLK